MGYGPNIDYKVQLVDSNGNVVSGTGTSAQQVQGTTASGSAVSGAGNPVLVAGYDGTNVATLISSNPGDAVGTSINLRVNSLSHVYDASGGQYRRMREAISAANTTGTGLLGVGALGFDGTNYQLARLGKTDGTAVGTTGVLAGAMHLWNGTGYQPAASTSTNPDTLKVQATLSSSFADGVTSMSRMANLSGGTFPLYTIGAGYNGASADLLRTASATGVAQGTTGILGAALMTWNGTGYQVATGDTTGTPRTGHYRTTIKSTPTVGTGTAYSIGDLIGVKNTLANAVRVSGGTGKIQAVAVDNKTGIGSITFALRVWFFDSDPSGTTFTDNGALNIVAADIFKVIGYVDLAAPGSGATGGTTWSAKAIELDFTASGSASIFMALEARGAVVANTGTTDWQINVAIDQD